jgi:hypothetical protein
MLLFLPGFRWDANSYLRYNEGWSQNVRSRAPCLTDYRTLNVHCMEVPQLSLVLEKSAHLRDLESIRHKFPFENYAISVSFV